jgi:DAK2 domain fusion protein YloV
MPEPRMVLSMNGPQLREMFAAATTWLDRNKEAINAINVFPVPDGDTGTNMYLTMRSTMDEAQRCEDRTAGGMLAAMSHGALMGARGNSGVILSQILRGVARAADGAESLDSRRLAAAFREGSAAAYKALTKPTEGTVLTVIREVSEKISASVDGRAPDLLSVMEEAVDTAAASVERTPTLLPVLAEAGVVDAGAKGLYVLLEGMLKHLRGEEMAEPVLAPTAVEQEWLNVVEQRHEAEPSPYGYCAEVLIEGHDLDVDELREAVLQLGDSVIVVGDEEMVRIHVHTNDPGAVLTRGTQAGQLAQVKIDNINLQAERFVQMHHEADLAALVPVAAAVMSTVAVAPGEGLAEVFRSTGCEQIVSGGPTMNPSTKDILDAIEACRSNEVVVLPNDKNIILAAEQAAAMTGKQVRVVKSRSVPQGLAALLSANPEEGVEENAAAMDEALSSVRTIEITLAARSTTIGGVRVEAGQVIAIVDDELKLSADSPEGASIGALRGIAGEGTSLISLYYGADTTREQAEALAGRLRAEFAGHEVEVVYGGQPHYLYIISLE